MKEERLPKTDSETLKYLICNLYTERFSNFYSLIFAVTFVASATGEQSFSTLRIERKCLCSHVDNDLLNGLIPTSVHEEYQIDHKQVAQKYLERPLGDLPFTAEPMRKLTLADMEDTDEIDQQSLGAELHGLDADAEYPNVQCFH